MRPESKGKGFVPKLWTFVKRALAGGAILVVVLSLAGAIFQRVATARDMRRFPPPGKIVTIGSHRLHCRVEGAGTPTVVFDAPIGASSLGWALVQPEVAKFTGTFSFDRAGYGWSDAGTSPPTSGEIVDELHQLLERSGLPRPYVLVGASFGGCNARLYAFRYPEEVAALVLVDPAHEEQFKRAPSTTPRAAFLRIFQLASRLGIMRLAGMPVDIAGMNVLPPDQEAAAAAVGYRTSAVDSIFAETAAIEQSFSQLRKARMSAGSTPLGNRPLIVLTHREEKPPVGEEAAQYAIWVDLHRELATESTRGRQRFVEKSGHFIAVDQSAKVVEAIREVVELTRNPPR
ncbi:MAG TPA: alpha/beta hydrolase [Thermoanaerobaculia bacterium]|nr:alpha/beta hydrolase [Thermoanaerobaculia bacterium]